MQIILILSKSSTQTCVLTSNKSPLLSVRTYKNNTIIDSSEHHEFNSAFILSKQPFISTFHLENLFFFHFFWDSSHIKLSNCYPNWNFIQIFRIYYTKWMFWYKKIQKKKEKFFFQMYFFFNESSRYLLFFFCSCNFYFIMLCWGSMLKMNEHIAGVICDHIQIWQ